MNALIWLATLVAGEIAPPPRSASTATVVLVAEMPQLGARAAVLRRAEPPVDVILLPRTGATVEDLAAALALLADARGRDGPRPSTRDEVLVVKSSRLTQSLDARQRLRLNGQLARLRAASARVVTGVGSVPAIDVEVRTRSSLR